MKKIIISAFLAVFMVASTLLPVSAAGSYIRGDADGDGVVTINDVTAIQRHIAGLEYLTYNQSKAANINNGALDISDATAIQMYLASYKNTHKIGEKVNDYELPFIPS